MRPPARQSKRLPKYAKRVGSLANNLAEKEVEAVAYGVATQHSGRCRRDKARFKYGGMNIKTYQKYLHVLHMWLDFCLATCMYSLRWSSAALTDAMWVSIAWHFFTYSGRPLGLAASSLESYMSMLSHVLIFMGGHKARDCDLLHRQQKAVIQRVVEHFCLMFPACRSKCNTNLAWDNTLVDKALQLLLQWQVYGHCYTRRRYRAWPACARFTLSMLNYLGWRPFTMTRDRSGPYDPRWYNHPILTFGDCCIDWDADGQAVSVSVFGYRTKFNRNPMYEVDENGRIRDRIIMDGT